MALKLKDRVFMVTEPHGGLERLARRSGFPDATAMSDAVKIAARIQEKGGGLTSADVSRIHASYPALDRKHIVERAVWVNQQPEAFRSRALITAFGFRDALGNDRANDLVSEFNTMEVSDGIIAKRAEQSEREEKYAATKPGAKDIDANHVTRHNADAAERRNDIALLVTPQEKPVRSFAELRHRTADKLEANVARQEHRRVGELQPGGKEITRQEDVAMAYDSNLVTQEAEEVMDAMPEGQVLDEMLTEERGGG